MSEKQEQAAKYELTCRRCRCRYDTLATRWCDCISPDRTLVCPECEECFCDAPHEYRRAFWENAPEALWRLRMAKRLIDFEPTPEMETDVAGGPLVLIVDDDRDLRRMAYHGAASLGCRVLLALDGTEGLALARRYHPDLVVTDALLPGLDGRELCLRLKSDPSTSGIPVVVMTSLYTRPEQQREGRETFLADEYLAKPIGSDRFRRTLTSHLDLQKQSRT